MKKVSEWASLLGGAMLALVLFLGLLQAFNVNVGQARSPFDYMQEEASKDLYSSLSSSQLSAFTQEAIAIQQREKPSNSSSMPSSSSSLLSSSSPTSSSSSSPPPPPPPPPSSESHLVAPENALEDLLWNATMPHAYALGRRSGEHWDADRQMWLANHPDKKNYTNRGTPRLFMLTGSQPQPCAGIKGDYLMLKSFKNKVDYCMLHDVQMFYNVAILDKNMDSFWSKLPLIRASMEAHPEAEWFWWVDADVVITDMFFELPLHTYGQYNLVVHGWETEVFEKKSVMGLNAGSFLIRNCGWSFKFMDRWASMGPKGPTRDLAGRIQSALLHDRPPEYPGDDQAALIYFMIREHNLWGDRILLERRYNLNGYWLDIVDNMESIEITEQAKNEAAHPRPRSFVTHFAGCQICTGNRNPAFKEHECEHEMERALNFADNQVLLSMGFRHSNLNSLDVEPLP